jgi:hypothetical protein
MKPLTPKQWHLIQAALQTAAAAGIPAARFALAELGEPELLPPTA